jgi:phosphonate transport system substrate-binding protein
VARWLTLAKTHLRRRTATSSKQTCPALDTHFQAVSKAAGEELTFQTAKNIPTFKERLRSGEYDIAYMNPYHYTVFHKQPGYQAIANARDKRIKGIIVVPKDRPIQNISQLLGSTLALPAPAAFAATVLPQAAFRPASIECTPKYVSSHDSVYQTVAKGFYPAGGGVMRTLKNITPQVHAQLRVLWTSEGFTPHAIAVHPRVAQHRVRAIAQALFALHLSEEGKRPVTSIRIKGFQPAQNADWDDARALHLHTIDVKHAAR